MSATDTHAFLAVDPTIYEAQRAAFDAACGYPSAQAETAVAALASAPRRADGWVLVAVRFDAIPTDALAMLADLVASPFAESLTRADYLAAIQPADPAE